jgi:hypothetical protein
MASLGMILVLSAGSMIALSWDTTAVIGIVLITAFLLINHWPNIKHHWRRDPLRE